jgi:RNA polymerase sigma factor (sigma-70 family)
MNNELLAYCGGMMRRLMKETGLDIFDLRKKLIKNSEFFIKSHPWTIELKLVFEKVYNKENEFLKDNRRLVGSVLKRVFKRKDEDLFQDGMRSLLKSYWTYSDASNKFSTYAVTIIYRSYLSYIKSKKDISALSLSILKDKDYDPVAKPFYQPIDLEKVFNSAGLNEREKMAIDTYLSFDVGYSVKMQELFKHADGRSYSREACCLILKKAFLKIRNHYNSVDRLPVVKIAA